MTPVALAGAVAAGGRKLRPKTPKEIAASPICIGFETLDRQMFDPDRTYPLLAKLGVKWARCQTGWARTETRKGEYEFAWLDKVVDSLLGIGIQPWFNLGYGNRLYSPDAPHESAVGWAPLYTLEQRQAWVRYVGILAERYGGRVKHWEIWNEANYPKFWLPDPPDADSYMDLVKLTVPLIRKRVPGVTIIGGAQSGLGKLDWVERCFQLGLADYSEKYSFHPYRPIPESGYRTELAGLRGLVNRYAPGMGLWQGENGAPSVSGSAGALSQYPWTEKKQAKWLLRRLMADLACDIELTSYFHATDMRNYIWGTGATGQTNFKGVINAEDYSPKESYFALQNLCTLFDAETRREELLLRLNDESLWSASFVRNGRPLYVYWSPADLHGEFAARNVNISVWSGGAAELSRPVLVDLCTGSIHDLPEGRKEAGYWHLKGAPLRDYPLVITDAEVVS